MALINTYDDGDMSAAQAINSPEFTAPFDGVATQYVLEQEFDQDQKFQTPLALNTPHPIYPNYLLVKETPPQPQGNGMVKWKRRYAMVPLTRFEPVSIAYNFIGFYQLLGENTGTFTLYEIPGRRRFSKTVTGNIQYDYFLVDGVTIPNAAAIPANLAQRYYLPAGTTSFTPPSTVTFTPTYPDGSQLQALTGIPADFLYDITGPNAMDISPYCVPTRAVYQGWINNGTKLVSEDSQLNRWEGNIFVRATKWIVAQ